MNAEVTDALAPPALSVVVVTRDSARTLRPIVAALARQSIARQVELVIVAPDERVRFAEDTLVDPARFHSVRVVAAGPVRNRGRAAAAGVLASAAPIVALTENHCFPDVDWAKAVVVAHDGPWAAVGPAVLNANPESALSMALHATGYGPFDPSMVAENRLELPLHNSSYRADALRHFADRLPDLLADERLLQSALLGAGFTLRFDPRPRKRHINEATWYLLTGLAYCSGRRYGGARSQSWGFVKRLVYAVAGPLLTLSIMRTAVSKLPRSGPARSSLAVRGVLLAWSALHAAGEVVSYVLGSAPAEFPFVEREEFLIRERLGNTTPRDPDIAWLVRQLDAPAAAPAAVVA